VVGEGWMVKSVGDHTDMGFCANCLRVVKAVLSLLTTPLVLAA
jgi:hypothetical protein